MSLLTPHTAAPAPAGWCITALPRHGDFPARVTVVTPTAWHGLRPHEAMDLAALLMASAALASGRLDAADPQALRDAAEAVITEHVRAAIAHATTATP